MRYKYVLVLVVFTILMLFYHSYRISNINTLYNSKIAIFEKEMQGLKGTNELNNIPLQSLKENGFPSSKIVIYISELDCQTCVDSVITVLNGQKKLLSEDRIRIIINSTNKKFLHYFKIRNNLYKTNILSIFSIAEIEDKYKISKPLLFFYDSHNKLQTPCVVNGNNSIDIKGLINEIVKKNCN